MPTIRGLNTSNYLKVLTPARTTEIRKTDGTIVIAKKRSLRISWEHVKIFFCRLRFLLFKTNGWINTRKIKSILMAELNKEITALQTSSLCKANHPSPDKIRMIAIIFEQLKKRVKPDAAVKKIEFLLEYYSQQKNILKKAEPSLQPNPKPKESEPETSETPPPPPSPPVMRVPFPLKENVTLEDLSPLLLKEYSKNIKKQLIKTPKARDPIFFEKADQLFDESWKKALSQMPALHQAFRIKYDPNNLIQVSTIEDVIVTSTLYQLNIAIDLIKKQFPHLTSLAYNLPQRIKIARLIQILLAGPSFIKEPLPQSDLCFQILELAGKQSPSKMIYLAPNKNFVDYQFTTFQQRKEGQDADEHFKTNLLGSAEQFIKDCLDRKGNQISIDSKTFEIMENIPETTQSVFSLIRDLYGKYLHDHPCETQKLIKEEDSLLFQKILEFFPCDATEFAISNFPKSCFNRLLAPSLKRYAESSDLAEQETHKRLLALQAATDFDERLIQDIAKNSGCAPQEIEPLMRKKMLQLMMIMNQSLHAIPIQKIAEALQQGPDQDISTMLMPQAQAIKFEFNNTHDFNSLTCRINFTITNPSGSEKLSKSLFTEKLPVAHTEATLRIPSFSNSALPKLSPFSKLKLGWLAPFSHCEVFASHIDPQIMSEQPRQKEESLRKKLEEICKSLEVFTHLSDKQEVFVKSNGELSIINLKSGWLFSEIKHPNITNLPILFKYFDNFFALITDYEKTCALLDKKNDYLHLAGKIPAILNGLKVLHATYKSASSDNHDVMEIITIQKKFKELLAKSHESL
ncbi:MAG: hypothetical protein CK425_06665 [Parachlamydia sp.]|nr:MAG: hypothetical protein CK425_06665 [Parachlamydia sp.]